MTDLRWPIPERVGWHARNGRDPGPGAHAPSGRATRRTAQSPRRSTAMHLHRRADVLILWSVAILLAEPARGQTDVAAKQRAVELPASVFAGDPPPAPSGTAAVARDPGANAKSERLKT